MRYGSLGRGWWATFPDQLALPSAVGSLLTFVGSHSSITSQGRTLPKEVR